MNRIRAVIIGLMVIATVGFLSGCEKSQPETTYFKPSDIVPKNATIQWLNMSENFNDTSFHARVFEEYSRLINADKFDSAATIIYQAGLLAIQNYNFDSLLINESIQLLNQYSRQLSFNNVVGIYCNIGCMYATSGDYDRSNRILESISYEPKDYESTLILIRAKVDLLYNYLYTGKADLALLRGYQALHYNDLVQHPFSSAGIYAGLAGVFSYTEDYSKAFYYLDKSIAILRTTNDTAGVFLTMTNKIGLLFQLNHPGLLNNIDTLTSLYEIWKPKYSRFQIDALSWQVVALVRRNKLSEARKILNELETIRTNESVVQEFDYSNYDLAAAIYNEATKIELKNKDEYLKQIPSLKKSRQYHLVLMYYQFLYNDAIVQNDYKCALEFQLGMQEARDSIMGIEITSRISQLNAQYNTEKLAHTLELSNQALAKKNLYVLLLLGVLLILAAGGTILILINKQQRLKKVKVQEELFMNQFLVKVEEERKRIAADLHDDIGHQLLDLRNGNCVSIERIPAVDQIIDSVRNISRNLHPVLFESIGLLGSIEQLVFRTQQNDAFFISANIHYSGCLSMEIELQLYRIIQEAVSNIIKHSGAVAGNICIEENSRKIVVVIKDNGKGFDANAALQSNSSFGLHTIQERCRLIGAKIDLHSNNKGTQYRIEIPRR